MKALELSKLKMTKIETLGKKNETKDIFTRKQYFIDEYVSVIIMVPEMIIWSLRCIRFAVGSTRL